MCRLLNLLADRAIQASEHQWRPFRYEREGADDAAEGIMDGGVDADDVLEEIVSACMHVVCFVLIIDIYMFISVVLRAGRIRRLGRRGSR